MKTSIFIVGAIVLAGAASAQSSTNAPVRLPEITVVAEKEPAGAQSVPVSVTAVTRETLRDTDARLVKDAAVCAPNALMTDFGPPKLSNPYFRGVGASPKNPGVTTYIDGVPQLNGNSSSLQLMDVDQIEFVRGPQGALFGRNTVGGLINIISRRPSDIWTGEIEGSYGNYNTGAGSFRASGPLLQDQLSLSLGAGYFGRDGYTVNSVTGHRLDGRDDFFGKGQLAWKISDRFEARLILSGEHDHDGDYALGDLTALRATPHTVARDFEGYTRRDIIAPTLVLACHGDAVEISSISGGVWWKTFDLSDYDYTTLPLGTRRQEERQYQFTQEFRLASAKDQPLQLGNNFAIAWQAGVFVFTQDHNKDTLDTVIFSPVPLDSITQLQTTGVGVYGQTKLTAWEKLDLIVGLRYDDERAEGDLAPAMALPQSLGQSFHEVTPQFGLAYRFTPNVMTYGTITRGYKAGGINDSDSPTGKQTFGTEHSWNYEIGAKTEWLDHRLQANLALFYIDWQQLQLPQFYGMNYYIDNAGAAMSKGIELELRYRPVKGWDLFGSAGYTDAEFLSGSTSMVGLSNQNVSGNRLPFTPDFTVNAGTQYMWDIGKAGALYARAEVNVYGNFQYDAGNQVDQDIYSLARFRAGWRAKNYFVEGWVNNAFDTHYLPVALYWGTTPSGYVGESGAPVTFGVRAGLGF
jgi:iron complex outermembrane receptor protein